VKNITISMPEDLARKVHVLAAEADTSMSQFLCRFAIRRLPPFFSNIRKRLVKSQRVYLRDTGLRHHLLNIPTSQDLDNHPLRGASWGMMPP
jgi:hypothetical protein